MMQNVIQQLLTLYFSCLDFSNPAVILQPAIPATRDSTHRPALGTLPGLPLLQFANPTKVVGFGSEWPHAQMLP